MCRVGREDVEALFPYAVPALARPKVDLEVWVSAKGRERGC